jgi:hypothetical protein
MVGALEGLADTEGLLDTVGDAVPDGLLDTEG